MYSKENSRIENQYRLYSHCGVSGKCVVCGDDFKSSRSDKKYCSVRCANDAYILKRRNKTEQKRQSFSKCIICGQPLKQTSNKIKMYCSCACKQKSYRCRREAVTPPLMK
jgi:hypothetical protein